MAKLVKVVFKRDFSPRKKGEEVELEPKLAEYYISIGAAKDPCSGCDEAKPCKDCGKRTDENLDTQTKKKKKNTDENA